MNPEQRFLQSRSSRLASQSVTTSTTSHKADDDGFSSSHDTPHHPLQPHDKNQPPPQQVVALFWKNLKQRLQSWTTRCTAIETRQQWLDLQQELQALRHYCLKSMTTTTTNTTSSSFSLSMDDLIVPDELPLADWRLLHEEFTNCTILLETIQNQQFPKSKFVFLRYRQEVARRKALGIPVEYAKSHQERTTSMTTMTMTMKNTTTTDNHHGENPIPIHDLDDDNEWNTTDTGSPPTIPSPVNLESITNAVINIREDGTIHITFHDNSTNHHSNDDHWNTPSPITSAVLLMKNLQNCTIQIHKVLEALHLVHIISTKVVVINPIASSIHITDCHDCSIQGKSQQLRIHDSQNLSINVDLIAGAILEGSHDIVFQRVVEVKDFDWLREGMASPNFRFAVSAQDDSKMEGMHAPPNEEQRQHEETSPFGTSAISLPETMASITPGPSPSSVVEPNNSSEGGDEDDEDEL